MGISPFLSDCPILFEENYNTTASILSLLRLLVQPLEAAQQSDRHRCYILLPLGWQVRTHGTKNVQKGKEKGKPDFPSLPHVPEAVV